MIAEASGKGQTHVYCYAVNLYPGSTCAQNALLLVNVFYALFHFSFCVFFFFRFLSRGGFCIDLQRDHWYSNAKGSIVFPISVRLIYS